NSGPTTTPTPTPTTTTTVAGIVTDAVSGSPIPAVTVAIQGKNGTTGADGRYSITGLNDGQATVTAQHQGHSNFTQSVTLAGATAVNITMTPAIEAAAAGSWGGQWKDNTPGSAGPTTMTMNVNTI